MVKAIWNSVTIAESDKTLLVDRSIYFPPSSLDSAYLHASAMTSTCPHKGVAHYYDVVVGDAVNVNAAWCYPNPNPMAQRIRGYVAFWQGVQIV
ncbi:MAG: DUF427 domain-containing protein [Micropepsaceae bacterium]